MFETFSKVEVITGVARRRRFPMDQKLAVVAETMQPGMSISDVAKHTNLRIRHTTSPRIAKLCSTFLDLQKFLSTSHHFQEFSIAHFFAQHY